MLIKTKHLLTTLVVAGITAFATQASATTYVAGDLLLSFRASGGFNSDKNLVVNLGQADTVYRSAGGNLANIVDIGTLLTSTYGANWNTRADLFWGIAGVAQTDQFATPIDGDPTRTNYLSRQQTSYNPGTKTSTAWSVSGSTSRANIANNITTFAGNFDAFSAAVTDTAVLDATAGGSWNSFNTGSTTFGGVSGTIEGNFASGTGATALDLYRILNSNSGASPTGTVGTGSWEGTFTINNAGQVGFAVTAVPEPSRALLAGLGLAGIAFRRRRTVKKTA
ncbi:MAG: PEP-CTERM sorting domain-containing protein [Verrucomicrobiaceae bacterium]|nr:PEP-CTERM sorting domain-containing protein [Verrucomicrobiaceae bacterium]